MTDSNVATQAQDSAASPGITVSPAYAAQSPTSPLAPFQIERRALRPRDVRIEILYCGVCHSDIHMARNEWKETIYPVVPGHVMVDSCRKCENCKKGLEQYCKVGMVGTYSSHDLVNGDITYGGYSKQIVVDENYVL